MTADEYDIDAMLKDAAAGNRVALGGLAAMCLGIAAEGDVPALEALAGAEMCARMAAAHHDSEDAMLLALVLQIQAHQLALAGHHGRAVEQQREADDLIGKTRISGDSPAAQFYVSWMLRFADQGDDAASARINRLFDLMTKEDAAKLRDTVPLTDWIVEPLVNREEAPCDVPAIEPVQLTRRERLRFYVSNIQWTLQCLGWAFADLWRAIRGKY